MGTPVEAPQRGREAIRLPLRTGRRPPRAYEDFEGQPDALYVAGARLPGPSCDGPFEGPAIYKVPAGARYTCQVLKAIVDPIQDLGLEPHEDLITRAFTPVVKEDPLYYNHFPITEDHTITLKLTERITQQLGLKLWPSGIFTAELVSHWAAKGLLPESDHHPTILELGTGVGFPTIVAANHGIRVVATDFSREALEILKENLAANRIDSKAVTVCELDWGQKDLSPVGDLLRQGSAEEPPTAILLAADCTYCPEIQGPLVRAITYFLQTRRVAYALVTSKKRVKETYDKFLAKVDGAGVLKKRCSKAGRHSPHVALLTGPDGVPKDLAQDGRRGIGIPGVVEEEEFELAKDVTSLLVLQYSKFSEAFQSSDVR